MSDSYSDDQWRSMLGQQGGNQNQYYGVSSGSTVDPAQSSNQWQQLIAAMMANQNQQQSAAPTTAAPAFTAADNTAYQQALAQAMGASTPTAAPSGAGETMTPYTASGSTMSNSVAPQASQQGGASGLQQAVGQAIQGQAQAPTGSWMPGAIGVNAQGTQQPMPWQNPQNAQAYQLTPADMQNPALLAQAGGLQGLLTAQSEAAANPNNIGSEKFNMAVLGANAASGTDPAAAAQMAAMVGSSDNPTPLKPGQSYTWTPPNQGGLGTSNQLFSRLASTNYAPPPAQGSSAPASGTAPPNPKPAAAAPPKPGSTPGTATSSAAAVGGINTLGGSGFNDGGNVTSGYQTGQSGYQYQPTGGGGSSDPGNIYG